MKALKIIGITALIAIAVLFTAGSIYLELFAPPIDTKRWSSLNSKQQSAVETLVTPNQGETFMFIYSLGVADFNEDGNLVTDQRVVSWFIDSDSGETLYYESNYDNITDLTVIPGTGFWDDTVITIHHADPLKDFDLWFAVSGGLDADIAKYIKGRLQSP